MPKILHEGDWFEQLSTEALYEEEYERILLSHASSLFPAYDLVPFKKLVYSEDAGAKADLALLHRQYREWWVVEVELRHHPFEQHVRPQVQTLSRARYGEDEARHIHAKAPHLDLARLCSMVKGEQPGVLVVVNASAPNWAAEIRRYGAIVTIFEVFRSRRNRYLYRLNGEQPADCGIQRSVCSVELYRMLRLHSPGILPIANGEKLQVHFREGLTEWSRLDISDAVFLSSSEPVSLNVKCRYELVELEDKSFTLYESS